MFAAAAGVATSPLAAHHSPIIFDMGTEIEVEGQVTLFDWTNPHVYIFVEATDDAGREIEWQFETDATPILLRNGWTRDSLLPGDRVSVRANPDRHLNNLARQRTIRHPWNRKLHPRSMKGRPRRGEM